jgi:hypothetical protein
MASSHLSRTFDQVGNRTTWTLSVWIKRTGIGGQQNFFGSFPQASDYERIMFNNDKIYIAEVAGSSTNWECETDARYRDVNAWYHLVYRHDTTQASSNDRIRLYMNGVQQSFGTNSQPAQNRGTAINTADVHKIGMGASSEYTDCEMAHFHWCDGQSYAPTEFGETDSTTGIWKPKVSPSVSYGTNGFFLKFDNAANMGLDSGGGAHNWTTNGSIIQNKDTPNNVFCTMNSLDNYWQASTFANTSNTITTSAAKENYNTSTLAMSSNDAGKYYCEVKIVSASAYSLVGLADKLTTSATSNFKNHAYGYAYDSSNGNIINNNSSSSYGNSYTTGDIIGIAVDTDNNKLYFSKNGTWQNSGDPTSGSTGTGAISISSTTTNGYYIFASGTRHNDSLQASWNFGNGYFGTTAVASAQNPDDGVGIFEYDVPAGYRALCTKSLNAQEYN